MGRNVTNACLYAVASISLHARESLWSSRKLLEEVGNLRLLRRFAGGQLDVALAAHALVLHGARCCRFLLLLRPCLGLALTLVAPFLLEVIFFIMYFFIKQ